MPFFDTPEPISVVISLVVGDARVTASDRTDTVVEVSPSDGSNEMDVKAAEQTRVEYSHGRLLVKAPKQWKHYSPFGVGGSIDVVIELPSGSHVQGDTSMGDFHGEGPLGECKFTTATGHIWLDHTGPLHLSTSAGGITVDRAVGHAEVTGSGEVRIREIDGTAVLKNLNGDTWVGEVTGDLRCNAANGDITVDRAHATIDAKTANGNIRIGEVVRGSVALQTASGELEVGIREGTAALLDVRSQFGRVRNSLDASDGPESSDETVEGRARTSHGDIVVRRS
jgi:DUF4097 and DUF4098 domain-containing protein YvlB